MKNHKLLLFIPVFLFLNSCQNSTQSQEEILVSSDSLWNDLPNTNKDAGKKDSLLSKSLGSVSLATLDRTTKCNLTKGSYILEKKITDSSALASIVLYLSLSLYESSDRDKNCPHPFMSAAYLFMNWKGYENNEVIAGCTVTPQNNYEGEAFVNTQLLEKYRKVKTNNK